MFKLITLTSGEMDAMERLVVCVYIQLGENRQTDRGNETDRKEEEDGGN